MFRHAPWILTVSVLAITLIACSNSSDNSAPQTQSGAAASPAPGATGVQWHDLRALDDLAEEAEATAPSGPLAPLRLLAAKVKPAAQKVATDPVPDGAAKPDQVQVLQKDMGSLADALVPDTMPEADLRANLAGVHPIVEQLMAAAGMPHVHEHPAQAKAGDHATTGH